MERNGWRLTAGATAFLCLVYGIIHLQVTRLELTSDRRDRRGAMEWGTLAIPLDSLRGEAPAPWQQRLAVYPLVGLLIKSGLKPAMAVTLFKTATLALWLLALDRYPGSLVPLRRTTAGRNRDGGPVRPLCHPLVRLQRRRLSLPGHGGVLPANLPA